MRRFTRTVSSGSPPSTKILDFALGLNGFIIASSNPEPWGHDMGRKQPRLSPLDDMPIYGDAEDFAGSHSSSSKSAERSTLVRPPPNISDCRHCKRGYHAPCLRPNHQIIPNVAVLWSLLKTSFWLVRNTG